MNTERIEEKLGHIEHLPTLPIVLRQIQKLMNTPTCNMAHIAAVVAKDQSLAARTIRLVNSAFYSRRTRVVSIQQAIVVLGLNTLRNLMIGLSVVQLFPKSAMLGFDMERFWQHSFAVAVLSKKMAAFVNGLEPEDCFIAGLLHDMGRLALQQFLHDDFENALKQVVTKKTTLLQAEKATFGFDHADSGAWLARRWEIPEHIIRVIDYHHRPFDGDAHVDKLVHIVSYANDLCISEGIGSSGECVSMPKTYAGIPTRSDPGIRLMIQETLTDVIAVVEEWTK